MGTSVEAKVVMAASLVLELVVFQGAQRAIGHVAALRRVQPRPVGCSEIADITSHDNVQRLQICLWRIASQTLLIITCIVGASSANSSVTLQGNARCLGSSPTRPSDSLERDAW